MEGNSMWNDLISQIFANSADFLSLSQNITLRGALAAFTSFFVGVVTGPFIIKMLRRFQVLQDIDKAPSEDLRAEHASKKGTPTMGGVIIILAFLVSILIWAKLDNRYVLWTILATVGFGLVGFLDDLVKAHTSDIGLSAKGKMILLLLVSLALAYVIWRTIRGNSSLTYLYFPFFREWKIDLAIGGGVCFILFATIVISGSSNAVNLTDGLDGLAIGCTIIVSTAFSVIAYVVGRSDFANYLGVTYIPGAGELAICCLALSGAGLAFLWFNCYPASVFMGDCGALMLGGFLGYIAVALRQEILLFIVGGIFVLEALSVMLQVAWFKLTHKRIFLCAPIHHHFTRKKWNETKVTIRFFIIEILLAVFALATLKIR